jgi:protein TonB
MTTVSYYEPKKGTPGALAMVIALHAAGITALALWKIDVTRTKPQIIDLIPIPTPVDPPEVPPEPTTEVDPPIAPPIQVPYVPPPEVTFPIESSTVTEFTDLTLPPMPPVTGTGSSEGTAVQPPPIEQSARAKGDVRRLFTQDDYPAAALRREESGSVRARLTIGADGRVAGCSVVASSGSAILDSKTCQVLTARARFTPAKDSNGHYTTDSYTTPAISWQLVDG